MSKAGLLLRGMRWRAGASVLTVITSAIAVGAAVVGPLYLETAGDSAVRSAVTGAPVEARGVTLSVAPAQFGDHPAGMKQLLESERVIERAAGAHGWYGQPITSILAGVKLVGPGSSPLASQLLSRTGICQVLRFREGNCVLGHDDVAVSDRSAREMGVSLGSVIHAGVLGSPSGLRLHVTGIYAAPNPDLPYWWGGGAGYFPFGHTTGGQSHIPEVDSLIASPATVLAVPVQEVPELIGQLPLRAAKVSSGDENALRHVLSAAGAIVPGYGIVLSTDTPSLLGNADRQRHTMATIVAVAAIELVVLALWVLGSLLVRTSEARRSEIRVARLRGFPATTMLFATAAEPAALCLVGMLIGVGAAWIVVVVARDRVLDRAASVSPGLWVFVALGASLIAIIGALGVGTLRLLRTSALGESASAPRHGMTHFGVVADIVLLVLSVVALLALSTSGALSGHSNPIASAAPGLIALGAAVLAVQVVLFVCRLGISASAFSRRIAPFLALRQVVRRPAVLRNARVLVIALGLACFATSAWAVARNNRADVATFNVGADTVVTVTPQGTGLEQAVQRVDPRGRFAMAAVTVLTSSSQLLAVDASRMRRVAFWPVGISPMSLRAISRALRPPAEPEVTLPDAPVRVTAATGVSPAAAPRLANLALGLWVFNPQLGTTIVPLGSLRIGTRTYEAPLAGACPGGCRLVGIGAIPVPNRQPPGSGTIDLSLTGVASALPSGRWSSVSADLHPQGWRSNTGGVHVRSSRLRLTLEIPASAAAADVGATSAIPPMVSVADVPQVLPAVATSEVEALNGGSGVNSAVPVQGLDGNTLDVTPVATVSALPRLGSDAVMVDLDLLSRFQSSANSLNTSDQVWLGPDAPRDAIKRLEAAGLRPGPIQRASVALTQAQRSAPALADDFLLVATVAALLAAAAATLGTLGTAMRQRATELAAFEVAGVSRRSLTASLAVEAVVLVVTTAFGIGAGVLAAAMAVPALPELAGGAPIPLQYGLPGGLLAAVCGAVLAVVLISCAAMAALVVTRATPSLLRTAADDTAG